ncbi:hypothetical protein [Nocardia huaxiensis]|uniref:DUF732 domain-containing protein n=1 Tax=Nocardia huaxiensis TaxID=2755382 RepID=A0A7D6V9W4_9NOCA|nr:hypothetical protein [Nocardia huaxiensis]QLY29953.1 hypothetical protein H0264_32890 [Nocardia huaxiensis]UFS96462.1 hypothetical protein LPY97_00510 [Nocardia huaxiensis]
MPLAHKDESTPRAWLISWKTGAGALVLAATLVVLALEMSPGRDHSHAETPNRAGTTTAAPVSTTPGSTAAPATPPALPADAPPPATIDALPTDLPATSLPALADRAQPSEPITSAAPSTAVVPDDVSAQARERCWDYSALVRDLGVDGALNSTLPEEQPILLEAMRLAAAGECG